MHNGRMDRSKQTGGEDTLVTKHKVGISTRMTALLSREYITHGGVPTGFTAEEPSHHLDESRVKWSQLREPISPPLKMMDCKILPEEHVGP